MPRDPLPDHCGSVEYRLLIERPGLHGPNAFYRTEVRELAELQLRQETARYVNWEPRTRVWMEQRTVGLWATSRASDQKERQS